MQSYADGEKTDNEKAKADYNTARDEYLAERDKYTKALSEAASLKGASSALAEVTESLSGFDTQAASGAAAQLSGPVAGFATTEETGPAFRRGGAKILNFHENLLCAYGTESFYNSISVLPGTVNPLQSGGQLSGKRSGRSVPCLG